MGTHFPPNYDAQNPVNWVRSHETLTSKTKYGGFEKKAILRLGSNGKLQIKEETYIERKINNLFIKFKNWINDIAGHPRSRAITDSIFKMLNDAVQQKIKDNALPKEELDKWKSFIADVKKIKDRGPQLALKYLKNQEGNLPIQLVDWQNPEVQIKEKKQIINFLLTFPEIGEEFGCQHSDSWEHKLTQFRAFLTSGGKRLEKLITRFQDQLDEEAPSEAKPREKPPEIWPAFQKMPAKQSDSVKVEVKPKEVVPELPDLLKDPVFHSSFKTFLQGEVSVENLEFIDDLEKYKSDVTSAGENYKSVAKQEAANIFNKYIGAASVKTINLPSETIDILKRELRRVFDKKEGKSLEDFLHIFDTAQNKIYGLISDDSLPRFLKTEEGKKALAAYKPPSKTSKLKSLMMKEDFQDEFQKYLQQHNREQDISFLQDIKELKSAVQKLQEDYKYNKDIKPKVRDIYEKFIAPDAITLDEKIRNDMLKKLRDLDDSSLRTPDKIMNVFDDAAQNILEKLEAQYLSDFLATPEGQAFQL